METQTNLTRPKLNAGFFFLSLGVLITLIASVSSFLNLVFETLNKKFPDVLNASYQYGYSTYQYESMRSALATLIIFFPVFLVVSHFWRKLSTEGMGVIDAIIRKWVIYIILFLSAIVAVVDLVTLVQYFISGEVTTRFILKVITVLVVVTIVGFYYVMSLRGVISAHGQWGLAFKVFSILLVVLAIFFSFKVMGSPMQQRLLRLDDKRVSDLQSLQWQVINYWQQKEKLPENLDALASPLSGYSLPTPPLFEKGEIYEYNMKSKLVFELCATFALPMPQGWQEYGGGVRPMPFGMGITKDVAVSYPAGYGINESWDHEAGYTCFERTIDKDMFPPFPKPATY
jgi:hypothetical protein